LQVVVDARVVTQCPVVTLSCLPGFPDWSQDLTVHAVPTKDEWRFVFRPQKTTDSNCLVHVTVQAGDAVLLHSPRFEIRTKPSA
jgi:hypothetical protein